METKKDPTLHEALAEAGYTSAPGSYGRRKIIDRAGNVIGEMTAREGWKFLGVLPKRLPEE